MSERKPGHHLTLLPGAGVFFDALVEAIDAAAHEVRLETYIFDVRGAAEQVALALLRAAERGVAVDLAVDGVGTPHLPTAWRQRFERAGVVWRTFRPLGRFGLLLPSHWRRLHRKLCVVDGLVAFCGGINLLDDWIDPNHGVLHAPRFDFALRVTGPLVQSVHATMAQFWWRLEATRSARQADLSGAWQALQLAVREKRRGASQAAPQARAQAELVLRDNVHHRTRIERAYRQAIGIARHDIVLANAYFLPGRKMRRSLVHAARRGVRVRLLLQGRYEYFLQYYATRALYAPLLAAGVEIYEYQDSFLHAKVAVIDGRWSTVGSSNIDPLSLLLAREANVVVRDHGFARELGRHLEQAIAQQARRVDPAAHAARSLGRRMLDAAALGLMRAMLFLIGKRY